MSGPKYSVSAAAVVMNDENKMLLIKGPKRGWEIPGGIVEEGEPVRNGVIREVKEETGIDIEIQRFCGVYQNLNSGVFATLWLAKPIGGYIQTSSESLEVGYFSIQDALSLVTWGNFRERIMKCLDEKEQPFFVSWS